MTVRTDSKPKSSLILVLAAILTSLLFVEFVFAPILLQFMDRPGRSLTLLGVVAWPDIVVDDVRINSQGFTGHILSESKPPETTRILTLGGSAMFNRRMTERLIESLSQATPTSIEIQGGAFRTHNTRSSLIKYQEHFYNYAFDYVLIYHGINDLWANHVALQEFRDDYSHLDATYTRNAVLNNSVIARYFYNALVFAPPPSFHPLFD